MHPLSLRTAALALVLIATLSGCPVSSPALPDAWVSPEASVLACTTGALRCADQAIEACTDGAWAASGEVCDPMEGETCAAGRCVRPCDAPEALGYVGCEYWPTVTPNFVDQPERYGFAVVVANPNALPVRVTVTRGDAVVAEVTIDPEQTLRIPLPWVTELLAAGQGNDPPNLLVHDGAYRLVSSLPVTVHQYSPFEDHVGDRPSYSNDASLLLPTSALGADYRVVAHASHLLAQGNREVLRLGADDHYPGSPGFFAVVATEDATSVAVHTRSRTQPGPDAAAAMREGDERTYTLDEGDVLLVLSKLSFYDEAECVQTDEGGGGCTGGRLADPTGTTITSSARVAVFGGHRCVDLPREWLFCDHLEEQMIPVAAWGRASVAISSHPIVAEETNVFRIVSASDDNLVEVLPPSVGPFTLDDGEFVDVEIQGGLEVRGTGRLQLVQYETSGQRTAVTHGSEPIAVGDPSMALVAPIEQQRRDYVFLSPASFPESFVLVTTPMGTTPPMLDGAALDAPTPIDGSTYGWLRVPLSPGTHRMVSDEPFGIVVQGVAPACSYMMLGGLDTEPLVF